MLSRFCARLRVALSEPPSAQSPFAWLGCYPHQGNVQRRLSGRYSTFIAHTGSCASPITSPFFRITYEESLCRLLPTPAGHRTFPTLSLQSLCRRLDPYPAVFLRCLCPFLPGGLRPHVTGNTFGTREYPCNAISAGSVISRLQPFVHLQAPTVARPPDRTHRGIYLAGRPGRLHHATNMRLPAMPCGIATCLNRAINMAELSSARLQPCRLPPDPYVSLSTHTARDSLLLEASQPQADIEQ